MNMVFSFHLPMQSTSPYFLSDGSFMLQSLNKPQLWTSWIQEDLPSYTLILSKDVRVGQMFRKDESPV